MIKKISIYLLVLTMIFVPKVSAQAVLIDENELPIKNGSTICSNQEYTLFDEGNEEYKNLYTYENHYFLEEYQTNGDSITIIIPNDVKDLSMVLSNGSETSKENFEFKVEDCSYDEIKKPYGTKTINSEIIILDNTLSFKLNHELEDYNLTYSTPKVVSGEKVLEDTQIMLEYPQVVQFNESYIEDGETVNNFYEMDIKSSDDYEIREVNSLDITPKGIKPISNKYIIYLVILFLLFLFFRSNEKKYRRKRRRLQEKRRRKIKHSKRKKNVKR